MTWVTFICMLVHWYDSAPATLNFITNIKLRYIVGNIIRAAWTELNLNNVFKMQIFSMALKCSPANPLWPRSASHEQEPPLGGVPWFNDVLLLRWTTGPEQDLEDAASLNENSWGARSVFLQRWMEISPLNSSQGRSQDHRENTSDLGSSLMWQPERKHWD